MKIDVKLILLLVAIVAVLPESNASAPLRVTALKCENLINPNAIDNTTPHFSWKLISNNKKSTQQFYEIQAASDSTALRRSKADWWMTGKTRSSESVMIPYKGKKLSSRSLVYWRVRVWNEDGEVSPWSTIARFGVGVLEKSEFRGEYIGLDAASGNTHTPLLRKKFRIKQLNTAFLHVNSLGYHEVYLNGTKVGNDVLSPSVSHLTKRTITVTYDLTTHLRKGENELVVWLGTGWYKKTGFKATHDGALVKAQLDMRSKGEWKTIVVTDSLWEGCESGYRDTGTWQALRFGGERMDAAKIPADMASTTLDQLKWHPVINIDMPHHEISPEMTEPNLIQEIILPQDIKQLDSTTWLIDMGKNLNGWFEIKFPDMSAGDSVIIEYTDFLNKGVFEDQGQKDIYIASGKGNELFRNKFNHHAFRYVKISNLTTSPRKEDLKAYLIHTNFTTASSFECSDPDLNAIHDMIHYTMKCLAFGGYMVDCPHLERAGYGGDGNSSTMAIQTMYDVSPLFYNWLMSWSDSMREGGSLPHVAPNPGAGGGGPYWCGFFVMAPWRTYLNYNDARLIEKYYPAMKQWLGYVDKYTVDGLLKRWPDTEYRDWYLGDWLAPMGVDAGNQQSVDLVNNCFISECLSTLEKIATVLKKSDEALVFKQRKEKLNSLIHETFFKPESKTYATSSQLDLSYPMLVGITPSDVYNDVQQQLFNMTKEKNNGHIGVGLVGVPILTEWAIRNKAVDFMYTMLKKRDYPGYLYMIDNDATTTWEYWSGERSRIHNCYNGIGSWFYEAIGGIRPDESNPGYKHVIIEPQIPTGLSWAKVTKETPYGTITVDWNVETGKSELAISLPNGVTATVILPPTIHSYTLNGELINVP